MNEIYEKTVEILLKAAPLVFKSDKFALKGGTAINLFIRELPRLSVDLDLVYVDHTASRDDALRDISESMEIICKDLKSRGFKTRITGTGSSDETKIFATFDDVTVKIEINPVMRGVISSVSKTPITKAAQDRFKTSVSVPMLSSNEVYAGKLVAGMDRQHPRDLFDVHQLISNEGINEDMIKIFVGYLSCHSRPIHEVLFGNMKDIFYEYENNFKGMTTNDIDIETLVNAREEMFKKVHSMLTKEHKDFLISLSLAEPKWDLIDIPHLQQMPGTRWKLMNLEKLKIADPKKLNEQADQLESLFSALDYKSKLSLP